ncbi:uncharacterized protein PAC_16328 [Phialocephala subalpina]|uniref:Uncharacterized protein n=1 Tax=Phialocephala subalpina TaxID=576137 RepID=A0A1L7XNA4_9HELO|nr:uncharacterized protein PAC_16328 [Phialocephala subalpina]
MAHSNYGPVRPFSSLEEEGTIYRSPATYSQPFPAYDDHHGDLGSSGIEMGNVRPPPQHSDTKDSMHSQATLFPSHSASQSDQQPFLHDPMNKIDTFYTANTFVPYQDHTGKQLRHILIGSSARWLITAALCGGYVLATLQWQKKNAIAEVQKKWYNGITTGISIALGLNIASAFKDMALNMRWPILAKGTRNLVELDLFLNCDSLTKLCKLVIVTKRPMVVFGCVLWLLVNLLAQTAIAMLSLTYGFNTDYAAVEMVKGNASIPSMDHFFPLYSYANSSAPSIQDEEYAAHMYGEYGYNYGLNDTFNKPKPGDIYQPLGAMIFTDYNNSLLEFIFQDSPTNEGLGTFSIYTGRTINVTYTCESHRVTKNGNGTSDSIEVESVGAVTLSQTVPQSTTYWTNETHTCGTNERCTKIEAFESSDTDPWYYSCEITMGHTFNDSMNVSYVSDYMAYIATAAIAQVGYTDYTGVASQIYPQDSPWGYPNNGSTTDMGATMATFALGAIAGATMYNPYTSYYGMAPQSGQVLQVNHPYLFYLMLGLICSCHLIFIIIVAIYTNSVMVGPDGHLSMAMLLRPIADALYGVSGGEENKAFRDAKRETMVTYVKDLAHRKWQLKMVKS